MGFTRRHEGTKLIFFVPSRLCVKHSASWLPAFAGMTNCLARTKVTFTIELYGQAITKRRAILVALVAALALGNVAFLLLSGTPKAD